MNNDLYSSFQSVIKHWWISLLVGILAVLLGIWCFATPMSTLLALSFLFVISFFVGGISEIAFALFNKNKLKNWGWTLIAGVVDIIFAIILLNEPSLVPIVFSYIIAFWILFRAIWGISMTLRLKQHKDTNWAYLFFISIIGIILAIVLFLQPLIAGLVVTYMLALGFIFYGIFRIYLAFRLKSLHEISSEK